MTHVVCVPLQFEKTYCNLRRLLKDVENQMVFIYVTLHENKLRIDYFLPFGYSLVPLPNLS